LSAAFSDKEDHWEKIPSLRSLSKARNATFHRRDKFTYPSDLRMEVLNIIAQHFEVTVDTSRINAAIKLRERLLRELAPAGIAN
jgi:hypothetical protein